MSLVGLYVEPHSADLAIGYPPCQQGVDLLFAIQPGQTLDARAERFITLGDAPSRLRLSLPVDSESASLTFKEAKADPDPALFHLQLQSNVEPPVDGDMAVKVSCVQTNGVRLVSVDPA